MRHRLSARQLGWLLPLVACVVGVGWLTSLERYLGVRYHISLEAALPRQVAEWIFTPSRWLDARVRSGAAQPPFRLAWPTQSDWLEPPAAPSRIPQPPSWQALPEALPQGQFLATLAQQKLIPGPQRILLAGDSMMQGIAPLLMHDLSRLHPDWEVHDLSRQSTGLTVRRYFDWPARIVDEMDAKSLSLVVIFLGPNDPWDIRVEGQRHVFPSPGWALNYAVRVDEIIAAAVQRKVRLIWVGLPTMPEGRIKAGAVLQNHIFHERARNWNTDYLATEPLVGILSEPFRKFMQKEGGQTVSLRAEDGVHLTPSGLRLINQALLAHIQKANQP